MALREERGIVPTVFDGEDNNYNVFLTPEFPPEGKITPSGIITVPVADAESATLFKLIGGDNPAVIAEKQADIPSGTETKEVAAQKGNTSDVWLWALIAAAIFI